MTKELLTLAGYVCESARRAGTEIMRFYRNGTAVALKADASPLTAADEASHALLLSSLHSLLPEAEVISEESDGATNTTIDAGHLFWLVDPLDGTKEFIKHTSEFTVNVALLQSGWPVMGVIHAPALNLTYYAARNAGSWRQFDNEPSTRIFCRGADCSAMSVVASRDHAGALVRSMVERLGSPTLQSMGSSLKFCLVAEGKADLYLRDLPTMEWDTAAAQCVVEDAGGGIYSLDGQRLQYGKPGLKNPAIMTVGDTQFDWQRLISPVGDVV